MILRICRWGIYVCLALIYLMNGFLGLHIMIECNNETIDTIHRYSAIVVMISVCLVIIGLIFKKIFGPNITQTETKIRKFLVAFCFASSLVWCFCFEITVQKLGILRGTEMYRYLGDSTFISFILSGVTLSFDL